MKVAGNPPAEIQSQARFAPINREQMMMCMLDIETLIGEDHPARLFWGFLERVDLSDFAAGVQSLEGTAGRPATDPRLFDRDLVVCLFARDRLGRCRDRLNGSRDSAGWRR